MHIKTRGVICDTTKRPEPERVASFIDMCATSSGSIFCTFQIGSAKNAVDSKLLICRSKDRGRTWQELDFNFEVRIGAIPGAFSSGGIVEVEPGRLLLIATWYDRSDPSRPFFNPKTEGILSSKQLIAYSSDEGKTWCPWRELPIPGLKSCANTGPILKWPDGTIAFPFESLKEYDDPAPAIPSAWCMVSKDHGCSFSTPILLAKDPENKIYYWDQRLCVGKAADEFIGLYWTHAREDKRDLRVHFRRGSISHGTFQCPPIVQTNITGQIAAPLLLDDGRILAFTVDRSEPGEMSLWSSKNGGLGWHKDLIVHVHDERAAISQGRDNIDYAQYWEDMGKWSFGHPVILALDAKTVLLAYYAGAPDCMSVHWAQVDVAE